MVTRRRTGESTLPAHYEIMRMRRQTFHPPHKKMLGQMELLATKVKPQVESADVVKPAH